MSSVETTCRFCGKKIRWVTIEPSGKPMPVDAQPMAICILKQPADGWKLNRRPWARVVYCWMPHFGSCPSYPRRSSPKRAEEDYQASSQTDLGLDQDRERERHP